jgi:two-component system sensor histidine kinase RpfC
LDDLSSNELIRSVQAQASLRLKFGLFVAAMFLIAIAYWGPARPETQVWEIGSICVAYLLYNLAAYFLSHHTGKLSARDLVVATAVLDPLMLSLWLFVAGEASILFVSFYLFTILGFGFRVGRTAMHLCQVVAIAGFALVSVVSPAWRHNPMFEISHLILLTVVPLYAGVLIGKLQAARAAAERASLAKSQLLAKVSHELRTPLTGIVSTASLIEAQSSDEGSVERSRSIIKLALGLDIEIKQLLDLSRIESGRDDGQQIAFEVVQVTDHIERTLAPIAAAKQVEFTVEVDPGITGPVMGDAHALSSVLMNLAGNAVKFTASGSVHVDIALVAQDEASYRVRFMVRDTGIGIPEDLQQKIFEPFFQVETGPVRKYGGTGLGTSIALAHVRRMGGELQLESAPGEGSRFSFELTMGRAKPEATPLPAAEPQRLVRDKHILVADDNRTNLSLISEMLERDGHRVRAVESGEAAIEALATEDFELVFLDFNMHDLDGATVYETYRFGRLETAPTFFVTADTSAMTAARLQSLGAAGVIYKPVTFDKLRSAVASQFPGEAGTEAAPAAGSTQRSGPHLRPVPVEYLDPAAIDNLRDVRDTPEFLCRMIADGVLDIERIDQGLSAAVLARDLPAVHREAHALRGVCLSLGVVRLATLADRLMTIGQRELDATSGERSAELRKTLDLSLAALDDLRQSLAVGGAARAG